MDNSIIFTEKEDETLINLVSQNTMLYDLTEEDYRNQQKKNKIWNEIATILNKSGDSCKKRWKNIKDTYFRQKRKHNSGTGSAGPKNPRSKFKKYDNLLSFLEAAQRERSTKNNIKNDDYTTQDIHVSDQLDESTSSLENEEQSENVTEDSQSNTIPLMGTLFSSSQRSAIKFPNSNKRQKKLDKLDYLQNREESQQKIVENMSTYSDDQDLASFSDHIRSVLKKLPPILKIKAKKELHDVLCKYEFLSLEPQYSQSQTISSSASDPYPYSPGNIKAEPALYSPVQDELEAETNMFMQKQEATDLSLIHFHQLQ